MLNEEEKAYIREVTREVVAEFKSELPCEDMRKKVSKLETTQASVKTRVGIQWGILGVLVISILKSMWPWTPK
jgi:hypothetical protein